MAFRDENRVQVGAYMIVVDHADEVAMSGGDPGVEGVGSARVGLVDVLQTAAEAWHQGLHQRARVVGRAVVHDGDAYIQPVRVFDGE